MKSFLKKYGEHCMQNFVQRLRETPATGEASRLMSEAAIEIERLAREAWTWSKACEDATKQIEPARIDAARYRLMRDKEHSLESRQRDKKIINGVSCYHVVDGVRELKSGNELDAAIDTAMQMQDRPMGHNDKLRGAL